MHANKPHAAVFKSHHNRREVDGTKHPRQVGNDKYVAGLRGGERGLQAGAVAERLP
jgi:hypothetical protein